MHSQHKHTLARTYTHEHATHIQHTQSLRQNAQPQCDGLMLEWLSEAKVTQSRSFIPIIPCVGWVRGLLMASTLQERTTALT